MPAMAEQPDTNAALWKSDDVVKAFVAQGRERQRAEQLTLVARLLPFEPADAFTFLDLGAGTGAASRAVLAEYPNATALLGDFSEQMMAAGQEQMQEYSGRYQYVELDMHASSWPAEIPPRLAAIISALSIHHLPDERKRSIFKQIFERLSPGAWYINFDPIHASNAELEAMWQRVNDRYDPEEPYRRTHRTPLEHARYENHIRYMIPLAPQLEWLREVGFVNVEVFWKRLDWVIFGGQRPA
jgi:tRNA (cmo5U34)-methyltransferase